MKFAILIEDYNLYYTNYLIQDKALANKCYEDQLNYLLSKKYYQADSLSQALIKLGHQSEVIIPACNPLQLMWAKEKNRRLYLKWHLQKFLRSFKSRFFKNYNTFDSIRDEVLFAQINEMKPNIVFVYSSIWINQKTIQKIKTISNKIILQWSCPISDRWKGLAFHEFNFIVSAAMPLVDYFKSKNLKSYYLQQAFDDSILVEKETSIQPLKDVVFIGNFSMFHNYRFEVIEYLLLNKIDIDVYGIGNENIPENSLLKESIKKPVNGQEMFELYKNYKLAIHIYGAGLEDNGINWVAFAGAKRNFEITGIGTALLTSYQGNLNELFTENEIITFKTKEECLEKINLYLSKPDELQKIAKAGQQKTLENHTFYNRAMELLDIIKF